MLSVATNPWFVLFSELQFRASRPGTISIFRLIYSLFYVSLMFESIVSSVLNQVLGSYVDNLDGSQLKLGIFSGIEKQHNENKHI